MLATDIGIDLGTDSVLVYLRGTGVVLHESSVVAYDRDTNEIKCIGEEARDMIGRTPGNIVAVHPLRQGVISDYTITEKMLRYFIHKAVGRKTFWRPRITVCVPSGVTEVEKRAVVDATMEAGARDVIVIEEPIAAALGAGIDITKPVGNIVVDIGGGTTDIAVISYGGVVVSKSERIAGNELDEAIMSYMRKHYKVLIGERTAEEIKIKVGKVFDVPSKKPTEIKVKGRCLVKGLPKVVNFSANETLDAIMEPLTAIIDTICHVIEQTPPELLGDVYKNGITLTGGGAKLTGLDKLIEKTTGLRARVASDPISCVALGEGKSLENLENGALGFLGSFGNS